MPVAADEAGLGRALGLGEAIEGFAQLHQQLTTAAHLVIRPGRGRQGLDHLGQVMGAPGKEISAENGHGMTGDHFQRVALSHGTHAGTLTCRQQRIPVTDWLSLLFRQHQRTGGVVEWLMAPVLKTGVPKGTVGSNPTLSVL